MSYLLTEIALEMLGYKFYDIEGNVGATSFQTNGHCISSNATVNDSSDVENNLENILELNSRDVSTVEHLPVQDIMECVPASRLEYSVLGEVSTEEEPHNHNVKFEKKCSPDLVNKKQFSSALSKLLDHEYERIRSEIERQKNSFLQSHAELLKADQRGKEQLLQKLICSFEEQEQEKLQEEFHTIHTFRKMVEQVLNKLNPENYEKYKQTFLQS